MSQRPLSDRAKKRLKIAAALLRGTGRNAVKLPFSRENFYEDIQAHISNLPEDEQQKLKGLTDWVEALDRAEENNGAQGAQ